MTTIEYLQSNYALSMNEIYDLRDAYWQALQYDVGLAYEVSKVFGINNDMLADILDLGYDFGIGGDDVAYFFDYYGYDDYRLGDEYDDFIWDPYLNSYIKYEDVGDTIYDSAYVYMDYASDAAALYGYTTSADAYTFTTSDWGYLNIDLYNLEEDLDIYLYDSYGNELDYSVNAGTSNDHIEYYCLDGEELTVIVETAYNGDDSNYMLDIYIETDYILY